MPSMQTELKPRRGPIGGCPFLAAAILVAYPVHRRMIAERSRTRSRARRPRRQTDAQTARGIYESA
jgi:hypothetical protein